MANPFEDVDSKSQEKSTENSVQEQAQLPSFDPLKLWSEAGKVVKGAGTYAAEALGLPSIQTTDKNASSSLSEKGAALSAEKGAVPQAKPAAHIDIQKNAAGSEKSQKAGSEINKKLPGLELNGEFANKVVDKIKDSDNPVEEIKSALKKLDNLKDASITMNGKTSHIEVNLLQGKTVAPPNFSSRGFRPVASHIGSHIAFDMTPTQNGTRLENVSGLSASVRGPLGRIRHSETTSLTIGRDNKGPFIQSSSDLYMRRRVHSSTSTLREHNFPEDSPMRSAMQHPDALEKVNKTLRLFQDTSDLKKAGIERKGKDELEVKSVAASARHVELNYKPEGVNLPVPLTVESLDLDKELSAQLKQGANSVGLENISGLKVNVKLGEFKASVAPSKLSIEKDMVKMELKNPEDGSIVPFEIPVSKLKEAAAKRK